MKDLLFSTVDSSSLPERNAIDPKYTWDLTSLYPSREDWEKSFDSVNSWIPEYSEFKGKLLTSADALWNLLEFDEKLSIELDKLHLYAMLAKDVDLRDNDTQSLYDRISALASNVAAASSYIRPELLTMTEEQRSIILSDSRFSVYQHFFENLLRTKPHTLSEEIEEILANSSQALSTSSSVFSIFTNADLKFPTIQDANGQMVEMSHGRFYAAMYNGDREYRDRGYKAYYQPFMQFANTMATNLSGHIKAGVFRAKVRKYNSALGGALNRYNIPISVYDNLISSINQAIEPMHRWTALKAKLLGLEKIRPYDTYVSLFSDTSENKYTYDKSIDIVKKSLEPLGEDYAQVLNAMFEDRRVDVYETAGKRSGAYSSGSGFRTTPYVLLNWNNQLNDVFTLTHEAGHNMHSFYSGNTQPYVYHDYTIFVAEVASTFNESLLLDYLLKNADSKEEKLYLYEKFLNNVTTTVFRQTMFAEFEKMMYEYTESDKPLTAELLCNEFGNLYAKYWGPALELEPEESYTWARIPHFYYNFYVYQYATGFAASEALVRGVKQEGAPAVERYLNFLKSGSSDYSIELLKKAGVDMNTAHPINAVTQKMNEILDEMELLIEN